MGIQRKNKLDPRANRTRMTQKNTLKTKKYVILAEGGNPEEPESKTKIIELDTRAKLEDDTKQPIKSRLGIPAQQLKQYNTRETD